MLREVKDQENILLHSAYAIWEKAQLLGHLLLQLGLQRPSEARHSHI